MILNTSQWIAGTVGASMIALFGFGVGLDVGRTQKHKADIMDQPRAQSVSAQCYTPDANLVTIVITVRTKEDLHSRHMEPEVKEFICKVASQFLASQAMVEKFRQDTTKYLGLPTSAMLMNVSIGPIK